MEGLYSLTPYSEPVSLGRGYVEDAKLNYSSIS